MVTREAAAPELALELREEGSPYEYELRLGPYRLVDGELRSPFGPVPGALVTALPLASGQPWTFPVQARTDVQGRFELRVPPGSQELLIRALPPGFALLQRRIALGGSEPIVLGTTAERGALRLELPEPIPDRENEVAQPQPVLLDSTGVPVRLGTFATWLSLQGLPYPVGGREVTLPSLLPGGYQLCWGGPGGILAPIRGEYDPTSCSSATVFEDVESSARLAPRRRSN